jgi:hypothetical protein
MESDRIEARLSRLENLRAIEQLQYEYAAAIDDGVDLPRLLACFVPTGRWTSNGTGVDCRGHEEIAEYFGRIRREVRQSLHYMTQPRVSIADDGRTAVLRAYVLAEATLLHADDPALTSTVFISTTYENRCVKVDGNWLFEHLDATRRHMVGTSAAPAGIRI